MFTFQKLFTVQAYDDAHGVFCTSDEETKESHVACVWRCKPLTGIDEAGMGAIISALSMNLKPGSVVQFGMLSTPDIEANIRGYQSSKQGATGIIGELRDRNVDFIRKGVDTAMLRSSGVKLHQKQLIITIKEPVTSFDELYLKEFAEKASNFASSLKAAHFGITKLNEVEFLALARKINHIYDETDDRYNSDLTLNDQMFFAGDSIIVKRNVIEFNTGSEESNNYFAKALSVKTFPQSTSIALMNHLIGSPSGINNQIHNPFFIVATFVYVDQTKKTAYVNAKSSWINNQAYGPMGRIQKVRYRKEGIDTLVDEIAAGNSTLVDFNLTAWMFGKSIQDVNDTIESIRTYWESIGVSTKGDSFILDPLWALTFPMNASVVASEKLHRFHSMSMRQAAQFIPIFGEPTGSSPAVMSLVTRRGEYAGFDLFNSDGNYNALIVAAAGSGKSFLTQRIIADYLAEGAKVWVIDSGHSYKKLAMAMKERATYIEFDPAAPQILNPFSQFLPERGGADKNFHVEKAGLINIIERMASSRDILSDSEISCISEAIESVYSQHFGRATIRHVADFLAQQHQNPNALKLGKSLYEFASGSYSQWFNGVSDFNLDNDFVVLELDNLKDDNRLMTSVLSVLMNEIGHEIYRSRDMNQKKILIIDEAWRLINDPLVVKAITEGFRTARKYNAAMVVVTQDIDDLYVSESTRTMANNASWLLVLQQKESAVQAAINTGKLSIEEYGQYLMKSLLTSAGEYSDLMVINGSNYGLYRLIIDRFTQVMFSTKGEERSEIMTAMENNEDVVAAIDKFVIGKPSHDLLQEIKELAKEAMRQGKNLSEVRRYIQKLI